MNENQLRALIVEDSAIDAELLELELVKGGFAPITTRVQTAAGMQAALDMESWDIVLCDYQMPRFTGMEALELLNATGKDIPFILISGSAGEDIAVAAMKAGAHDYFMKGRLALLVSAIRRELHEAKLRAEARAQREQLQRNEKLAALGTLLAGVAHELNNPLLVIMHQTELLERALNDDPRQVRANNIMRAVRRCSSIVRNFLALTRNEPPRRVPTTLNAVVHEVLDLAGYGLRTDGIDVTLDLAESLPVISADPQQLQQVVLNLVSNAQYALRARPRNRILRIRSTFDAERRTVTLQIEDNAGGIPAEIRSRIFDPFFTTKPIGEGTGLGLSLCHGIITAHGGTITVTSEMNAGTTFLISLPVDSGETAKDDDEDASDAGTKIKGRILVVDDDPDVAIAFSDILSARGHRVDMATNGRSVLELLDDNAYDLVLSDMRMPEIDGLSLYREIVIRRPHLERCFIFVTEDVFNADHGGFLAQTGAVLLSKPCSSREVENAVQRVLRNRRAGRIGK
jgi:signal transduction histidine kinase